MAETLTRSHPLWEEFASRLYGPEGCDFHQTDKGPTWLCAGGHDKTFATAILTAMAARGADIDIPATLAYFDAQHGHCDCEIIFNIDSLEADNG